jgi:hypothetical protein
MADAMRASVTLYQRSCIEDRSAWYEYKAHIEDAGQAEQRKASFQLAAGLRYTKTLALRPCDPPEAVDVLLPHDLAPLICCCLAS